MAGPIDAVLYQPTRPGIGVGESQVFDSPRTDRAIDFMRQENMRIRAEERQQLRKERDNLLKTIDTSIASSANLEGWAAKDTPIALELNKKITDYAIENMDVIAQGGAPAMKVNMEIQKMAGEMQLEKQKSAQTLKRAELLRDAINENEWQYNQESLNRFREIVTTPGAEIEDWMLLPDKPIDVDAEMNKAFDALGDGREGFYIEPQANRVGQIQETTWRFDDAAYEDFVREKISGNLMWEQSVIAPDKQAIGRNEKSRDEALEEGIQRLVRLKSNTEKRHIKALTQPGGGGRGSGKQITPQQIQKATNVKQAVREYARGWANPRVIAEHVKGLGYQVEVLDNGDLKFYQVTEGKTGESRTKVETIGRDNEEGLLRKMREIDKELTQDMIDAAPDAVDPDVRWGDGANSGQGSNIESIKQKYNIQY